MKGKALALVAGVFAADRLTKLAVERTLALHESWTVFDGVRLTHVRNTGVVFGLMGREDHPLRGWPIATLSAVVLAALLVYLWTAPASKRLLHLSLAFVIGGAMGNLWDRIGTGFVTDFVVVSLRFIGIDRDWPAFNVADASICVGVALMALDVWRGERKTEPEGEGA